jgi:hypothetical protein
VAAEVRYRFMAASYGHSADLAATHHLQALLELLPSNRLIDPDPSYD